ncbi:MAG TPA: glycosyltransferase family 39 protein, partial [Acidobacteriota bacterium]|nr:glycosyltransferase family 39 protein [Acidobacteriota bacterium]
MQQFRIPDRRIIHLAAGFLITLMAVRLLLTLPSTGMVTDEFAHIPAAYLYVKQLRLEVNAAHPPLIKYLAGLPLLLLNPPLPNTDPLVEGFAYDSEFLYGLRERARQVITLARIPMILVGCLLGFVLYTWAIEMFGPAGGLFSLSLFVFEPNILAHSRFVLTDVGAALAYTTFWYSAWRWIKTPSARKSLIVSGVAGLALLVKHSMIILPFCWLLILWLMVVRRGVAVRRGLQQTVLGIVLILLMLNAGYCFQSKRFDSTDLKVVAGWFGLNTDNSPINGLLNRFSPLPVPSTYIRGLDVVVNQNRSGHPAYLMGMYSTMGWWYYFPVAALVKVPLAMLVVFAIALIWL